MNTIPTYVTLALAFLAANEGKEIDHIECTPNGLVATFKTRPATIEGEFVELDKTIDVMDLIGGFEDDSLYR